MPKFPRRRRFNRFLNQRRSTESISRKSSQESSDEEEHQIVSKEDAVIDDIDFLQKSILDDIGDLFSFCKQQINTRFISVLLYITLRHFGHSWRQISSFMGAVGGMTVETAHKWSIILLNNDFEEFINDGRGGKHSDTFYDTYPEIKLQAKQFVFEECMKKEASFTAATLAKFIDDRFYEITDSKKVDSNFIRSIASCKLDLRLFGAKFKPNAGRPYFLGHERDDVVQHRKEFVKYFMENINHFYTVTEDDKPKWKKPTGEPVILICIFFFFHSLKI